MNEEFLAELARLLTQRNTVDADIARLIGRPAERGHIGEAIAAAIFDIGLHGSATTKGSDGVFRAGSLAGRTVNVKFYGQRDGCLDMKAEGGVDFYLALTGPPAAAASSRGATRPLVIDAVYLFESDALLAALSKRSRPPKVGIATSVAKEYWEAAEIWRQARNRTLPMSEEQRRWLQLFASPDPIAEQVRIR